MLVHKLCKTEGQFENLIGIPEDPTIITDKHAVAANLLAKLPHQNLTLLNALATVVQLIEHKQDRLLQNAFWVLEKFLINGNDKVSFGHINYRFTFTVLSQFW